jgi:cell division protein FtsL
MEVVRPLQAAKQRRDRAAWVFDLTPQTLVLATIILVALTSMLYLTQASNVAATGYDITYAQDERVRLERELQQLTIRAAQLQALNRVEGEATSKLGMVPAPVPEYVPQRDAPLDVEASLERALRDARREPNGLREQLAALLRLRPTGD